MIEKLKSFLQNDQLFYGFLLLLVGISSFGLGRLTDDNSIQNRTVSAPVAKKEAINSKIAVEANQDKPKTNAQEATVIKAKLVSGTVVASKSGTKYHLPDCPGAKQIKPANLISFESEAEAKAAGYSKASNCPGLE